MIRNHLAGIVLVALLMVSALTTCLFAVRWYFAAGEIQRLQARADSMTRTSTLMQQLAAESVDYGRRNPAIHPLLSQLNLKAVAMNTTNAGPSVPAQP